MLALGPLASTRMACPGFAGELELRLSVLYRQPLSVSLGDDRSLILEGVDTVLRYRLEDWVQ
jgi:heat shock protein HslJ